LKTSLQCILLAAGKGSRLGQQTEALPKTLLPLGGKPLCHHIIDSLIPAFTQHLIVVGGFEYTKLKEALSGYSQHLNFMENPDFEKGNLLTLLQARSQIQGSFCIFNADHFYSQKILRKIFKIASDLNSIAVICDSDRKLAADDMKVAISSQGKFVKMEKNLTSFHQGYIGVSLIPEALLDVYWKSCDRVLSQEGPGACVEKVINELAGQGCTITTIDVSGSHWFELDTIEDYEKAQLSLPLILKDS
jgi:choline kinase